MGGPLPPPLFTKLNPMNNGLTSSPIGDKGDWTAAGLEARKTDPPKSNYKVVINGQTRPPPRSVCDPFPPPYVPSPFLPPGTREAVFPATGGRQGLQQATSWLSPGPPPFPTERCQELQMSARTKRKRFKWPCHCHLCIWRVYLPDALDYCRVRLGLEPRPGYYR